jgi:hypothetical protein
MTLDAISNLFANLISAFAGMLVGIGSMWFSKVSKKEFNDFSDATNKKIDKLETETIELKDRIYQKLMDLSADIAVIKDREK